jgi:hypothetical protein
MVITLQVLIPAVQEVLTLEVMVRKDYLQADLVNSLYVMGITVILQALREVTLITEM